MRDIPQDFSHSRFRGRIRICALLLTPSFLESPLKNYPHPIIAREGWPFIFISVVVSAAVAWKWPLWSIPLWLITIFVIQFFRDPGRVVPDLKDAVLAPADGRIVVVEKARDVYADRDALKISVFMNVFNVHSNRSPVDGKVESVHYFPGSFLNAAVDKASTENERNAMIMTAENGQTVTCVQVAGLVARRILCYAKEGMRYARGDRYGFIRFGSRVDVYLPLNAKPMVTVGDKVSATETILAQLQP